MKNKQFEQRRHPTGTFRRWARPRTVTRRSLIRAFTTPDRSRQQVLDLVADYMGDSPVPPSWSRASVRGRFGVAVARRWARHIRHLSPARYRDAESGRWLLPTVQTLHDFGRPPGGKTGAAEREVDRLSLSRGLILDEAHLLRGSHSWRADGWAA